MEMRDWPRRQDVLVSGCEYWNFPLFLRKALRWAYFMYFIDPLRFD